MQRLAAISKSARIISQVSIYQRPLASSQYPIVHHQRLFSKDTESGSGCDKQATVKKTPPPPPPKKEVSNWYILFSALAAGALGLYLYNRPTTSNAYPLECPADMEKQENQCAPKCKTDSKEASTSDCQHGDCRRGNLCDKSDSSDDRNCVDLPPHCPYIIVGAGTAALSAYRAIKSNDPKAKVLMIGEECNLPYQRPPLSKELWFNDTHKLTSQFKYKQWNGQEKSIFYEKDCFYMTPKQLMNSECGGVGVALGRSVKKLDVVCNKVILDNGKEIAYDKLLIASGGKPKQHPVIAKAGTEVQKRTILFRKLVDFQKLDCITAKGKSVAIIGGGFLGTELAIGLGHRSKKTKAQVHQIFPEKGNMGKVLPDYLSKWTMARVRKENVNIIAETNVTCARMCGNKVALTLSNGQEIKVDEIVVAVGLEPSVSIAECSGLEVDPAQGGFLVNAEMKARDNIWVAGDAASFYDVKLGRRRIEHHDHAVVSGRLAGDNMSNKSGKPYWHQSMFWSDLGPELGFEAIGLVDNNLPTTAIFAKACVSDTPKAVVEATGENLRNETENSECPVMEKKKTVEVIEKPTGEEDFGKGVIFYMRDNVIVGIVMWNVFNKMVVARKILREMKKCDDLNEVAKLFELHKAEGK